MLHIFLFGSFQVCRDGDAPGHVDLPRSAQLLLARLLLQPPDHPLSRNLLIDLFWGERPEEQAHSCLNTALWRLRRVLEPEGTPKGTYLRASAAGEISFNWESPHWLDVAVFQAAAQRIMAAPHGNLDSHEAAEVEAGLRLYTGELMECCYEDWVLEERERLRVLQLNALGRLMRLYRRQGAYEQSLTCGRAIIKSDPLREDVHREIMRLYLAGGQRAQAIRQYEICRDTLARELAVPPMEETQRLYREIIADSGGRAAAAARSGQSASLEEARQQLSRAMADFEEARVRLRQAVGSVEYYEQHISPAAGGA